MLILLVKKKKKSDIQIYRHTERTEERTNKWTNGQKNGQTKKLYIIGLELHHRL